MKPPTRRSTCRYCAAPSGANVLFVVALAKFHAQAIRKVWDIGWKPTYFVDLGGQSLKAVIQPAGVEKAIGLISANWNKSMTDPQWHNDPEYKEWLAWMKKYNPSGDISDDLNAGGSNWGTIWFTSSKHVAMTLRAKT